ncbi:phospholipase A1 member A-like isoform X2 [Frankliniella occidentalis]|uniref:Phospholipase A1 member A-like isoform X2 n=1 Tax=Frankliniella occidentalis TaxID=133901 RepID=A0A9C6U4X1_FRAOC|nr:phospholipase A1 member A-like isoform X2 [Frankliniella occidentalis]
MLETCLTGRGKCPSRTSPPAGIFECDFDAKAYGHHQSLLDLASREKSLRIKANELVRDPVQKSYARSHEQSDIKGCPGRNFSRKVTHAGANGNVLLTTISNIGDSFGRLSDSIVGSVVTVPTNLTTSIADGFSEIQFILMSSDEGHSSCKVGDAPTLLKNARFNESLPTAFFIHGYLDGQDSESLIAVSGAFVRKGSHNIIAVDWSEYSGFPYLSAFSNLPGASRTIGDALSRMVVAGLPAENIWLIGHSLGAQMTGVVAQNVDFRFQRITGLDPAGPGFGIAGVASLTRDAAALVEVVHTDAGSLGTEDASGHIDIWPNKGKAVQPGCLFSVDEDTFCSHARAFIYLAEAVEHPDAFPAVRCASWNAFRRGECPVNGTNVVYLGYSQPDQGARQSWKPSNFARRIIDCLVY